MKGKNNYSISSGPRSKNPDSEIVIYKNPVYLISKRCFDIVFSLMCLIVFAIPMLLTMLIIVIDSPGAPPIYTQD